jgi:4-hydroxy-tetrahydrodipicolinate synthase
MNSSSPNELAHGVYAALATPRRKGLAEPDTAALLDYLDAVVQAGVNGIVLFGSTGEFIHFDIADRMQALKLAIRRSRVPVLVNVSHSTLDGAVALADDAVEAGAAGLLLLPPYFYRYGDAEIEEFYLRFVLNIAERSPVYLYNIPAFTNALSAPLATRLLSTGHFAGIKDSSGDWQFFDALQQLRSTEQFQLLMGNERIYLRGRQNASGLVSGLAAVIPEMVVALDKAFLEKQEERVTLLHGYLADFLERVEQFPPTVAIKQAAIARGWRFNSPAVPLSSPQLAELDSFHQWLQNWLPQVLKDSRQS